MGLRPNEYERLTHYQLMAMIQGYNERVNRDLAQTRLLAGYFSGKDPRQIIPLPGDWDHVPVSTQESAIELAKRLGMTEKWNLDDIKSN